MNARYAKFVTVLVGKLNRKVSLCGPTPKLWVDCKLELKVCITELDCPDVCNSPSSGSCTEESDLGTNGEFVQQSNVNSIHFFIHIPHNPQQFIMNHRIWNRSKYNKQNMQPS